MSAIEQRARELLVAAYRGADYSPMMHESHNLIHGRPSRRERAALDAIIAALTPPEGYVLVSAELLEDLAAEAEAGIHQTVFVPSKRERRMQFVRDARALIANSQQVKA